MLSPGARRFRIVGATVLEKKTPDDERTSKNGVRRDGRCKERSGSFNVTSPWESIDNSAQL